MAYITEGELTEYYTEIRILAVASQQLDPDEIDSEKMERAIGSAEALVNDYLRGRYTVPVTASERIKQICFYLSYKNLCDESYEIPISVMDNYKQAIKWLEEIRDGKMFLPDEAASTAENEPPLCNKTTTRTLDNWRLF